LRAEQGIDPDSEPAQDILRQLQERAEWEAQNVTTIFRYVHQKIVTDQSARDDHADFALVKKRANTISKAYAMIALCRAAKIPARLVTGFILIDSFDNKPHFWVETFVDDKWVSYDPENGYYEQLPTSFLPISRLNEPIVRHSENAMVSSDFDITEEIVPAGLLGHDYKRLIDILDFTRLPILMQSVLTLLLVLPVGVLITAGFSQFLGVRTYGTFSASLLAMALVFADWLTVTLISVLIIVLGLSGRSALPKNVTKASRLTVVFTLVALSTALGVSAMEYYDLLPSAYIVLLPMVVMANLVDRFYSVADESGIRTAAIRLIFTCLIASICFFLFQWQRLSQTILAFPELHFFTMAIALSFTLYRGKKLKQLPRFQWLEESRNKTSKKMDPTPNTSSSES
jgi:hypothetical protein